MKRHIISVAFILSIGIGFLVNIVPQNALAQNVPSAPTLDATNAQIQSATFNWVNVQEIDAVFTETSGPVTVQFVNISGMANYWNSDPAAGGTDPVNHVYQYPSGNTCGSNKSIIYANPYYSTKGERYFYAHIWANDPTKIGSVCREVDITVGNLTVGSVSNSNAFFTFSGTSIVRSDGDTGYTFMPSGFTNIWIKSTQTGSTCPDTIVYNPGAGDTMGNATLYPLSDGGSYGFSAPPAEINAASSCVVNNNSSDVNDDPGILGVGSAQSSDGANAKTGAVTIHINGTPPSGTTGPTGSGGSTTVNGITCPSGNPGSAANFSSTVSDSCLMPTCQWKLLNPATWIICPIITGGEKLVGQLDNGINGMLNVNTCQYFANINAGSNCTSGTSATSNQTTSNDFYSAWASFRDIALGIIVIAVLIMILAQAIGFEAVSAYSFKKMMPRIVIVVIGISISWYILAFAVQLSDDLGNGIRYLIYSPFTNITSHKELMNGGEAAISSLLVVGAGLALGIIGLLTLVLTAAIAVAAGFALLLFRNLAIIVFLVLAPIAIAFYALPNTEKLWKLWSSNLIKILLMFPIIAAFIASGRVLSAILYTDNNTIDELMAFVVYFAPYFMIPTAFKLAGGIMASAGNVASSLRGRVNQPLTAARKNILKDRAERARNNNLFKGESATARRMSGLAQNVMLANKAGLNPRNMRASLNAAKSARNQALAGKVEDSMAAQAVIGNDDLGAAALHGDQTSESARQYLSSIGQRGQELEQNVAAINQARREMGRDAFHKAVVMAQPGTGTGFGSGPAEMLKAINKVYGSDRAGAGRALVQARSNAQRAGRIDLAGAGMGTAANMMGQLYAGQTDDETVNQVMTDEALRSKSIYEIATSRNNSLTNMTGAIQRRTARANGGVALAKQNLAIAQNSGQGYAVAQAELVNATHEQKRILASTSTLIDVAGNTAEDNAQIIGGIMGQRVDGGDEGTPTPQQLTLSKQIHDIERSGDPEYNQYKRVISSEREQYLARGGTGGQQGPGGAAGVPPPAEEG